MIDDSHFVKSSFCAFANAFDYMRIEIKKNKILKIVNNNLKDIIFIYFPNILAKTSFCLDCSGFSASISR